MEGMVARECREIQCLHLQLFSLQGKSKKWMVGMVTKLLECTHGLWLYRNILVYDRWKGSISTFHKEQILVEIEEQLAMDDDLLEEDQYLMEVNLEVSTTPPEHHRSTGSWPLRLQG